MKVKHLMIATGGALVVLLHYHDANFLNVKQGDRVSVKSKRKEITSPFLERRASFVSSKTPS
jgi:anaerobic selenocysteine-containing dehydrogenase